MDYKKVMAFIFVIPLCFSACSKEPVKVGYIAGLSGRQSQLGVSGREAVLMAAEDLNESGGINGRDIQIIMANDQSDPDIGTIEIKSLVEAGVIAIVGPLTSNMITAVESVADDEVLIISPTITTSQLSNRDDNFIRVIPDTEEQGRIVAGLMLNDNITTAVVVYDSSNSQYTEEVQKAFIRNFNANDGKVIDIISYNGVQPPDSIHLAEQIMQCGSESVFIISSGNDAALIAQQLWKNNAAVALYGSRWTKTDELLKNGGKAVEGMKVVSEYVNSDGVELSFDKEYRLRTGFEPSFAAVYAFECAGILFEALKQTPELQPKLLKQKIINQNYEGLYENFSIDSYGDAFRTAAYSVITDGKFSTFKIDE